MDGVGDWLGIDIGTRNLAFCHVQDGVIQEWRVVDLLEECKGCWVSDKQLRPIDIHTISRFCLPSLFPKNKYNHVCIETQPHGKKSNSRQILLSELIFNYFQNHWYDVKQGDRLMSVRMVSPGSKYKKTWLTEFKLNIPKTYKDRKNTSKLLVPHVVRKYNITIPPNWQLTGMGKEDDLADALLLVLSQW